MTPITNYVMPHHRRHSIASNAARLAHVVEGQLVSTGQIAKRIGVTIETARKRVKRGPFPLTWAGLGKQGRKAA